MQQALADLTKLRRPLAHTLLLIAMGACIFWISLEQHEASSAVAYARSSVEGAEHQLALAAPDDPAYAELRADYQSAVQLREETEEQVALIASTQSPLGALGVAAGLMSSGVGLLMLLVLAAAHVAGEWHGQTIKEVIGSSGRRITLALAKTLSLFVYGLGLVLCSWVALILWGLISKQVFPIPHSLSVQETWAWVWPTVVGTPAVIFLFAAFGVALGSMLREIASTVVAGAAIFLATSWFSRIEAMAPFLPPTWVANFMQFGKASKAPVYWWITQPADNLSEPISLAAILTLALATVAVSARIISKRDVC